jgi:hypothetical protein
MATIGKQYSLMFILKKIFSRTSRPITIKLGIDISCIMGIQVYSNEGSSPLQRGDDHKSAKIG